MSTTEANKTKLLQLFLSSMQDKNTFLCSCHQGKTAIPSSVPVIKRKQQYLTLILSSSPLHPPPLSLSLTHTHALYLHRRVDALTHIQSLYTHRQGRHVHSPVWLTGYLITLSETTRDHTASTSAVGRPSRTRRVPTWRNYPQL